jgi:YVTN family beta-propeller protein
MSPAFRPLFGVRSAVFTTTFVVAAALLAACSEKSQSLADYVVAICAAHFRDASSAEMPFLTDNVSAMSKMMVDMGITPSGDVDRDFVAMMVPHHQGAIDMAQAELRYGHNEQLRRMGTRVYVGLENEDRIAAIDTLTNKVIATSPGGQAAQAVVYVPNAVPVGPARRD